MSASSEKSGNSGAKNPESDQISSLGQAIRYFREEQRMTQGALAEATSEDETERVDKQRISDIERGATQRLHSNTLMKLCDGLGITLDNLKAKEREFARAGKAEDTRKGDLGIALSFRRKLTAFREEYLVSDRGRVPFGGRDAELDQLNSWLFSESRPSRLLFTAPAGRGKSALVVQWIERQSYAATDHDRWQIAFMPISIRVGTNRPEEFYQGLALRLSEISDLALDETRQPDADYFKASVRKQIEHIAEKGIKVLVVLDGIDEALEGTFDAGVIPRQLPPTLRVLISARWQLRDNDSKGWLRRLDWDHDTRAETMELEKLDAQGIADVLIRLGAPMDIVAREPGLVEELTTLTEGEPLLVRFYCADLWGRAFDGARITVADLDTLKPGFGSYFEQWLKHQEQLWKQEGTAIDGDKIDRVLVILAHALGPLPEADLLTLMKEVHDDTSLSFADRLLRPLRRFVMGDGKRGTGFVLSHPKIGGYLRAERFHAAEVPVRRAFADWGRKNLAALNSGEIKPENASHYVLLYLPQHLVAAGAPASDFMAMVENGWRLAWEALDGGTRGFSEAVKLAWAACRRDGEIAHLGAQWRCALTLASLKDVGRNTPSALITAAVAKQVLTPRQAAHLAELKGVGNTSYFSSDDGKDGVEILAEIATSLGDDASLATELALAAISMANGAKNELIKSSYIEKLARVLLTPDTLPKAGSDAMQEAILRVARSLRELEHRAKSLCAIAEAVGAQNKPNIVAEAQKVAEAIDPGAKRAAAFIRLLPLLDEQQKTVLVNLALEEICAVREDYDRANCLEALAPYLAAPQCDQALRCVWTTESKWLFLWEGPLGRALRALAPGMSTDGVSAGRRMAAKIENDDLRAEAICALSDRFRADELAEELPAVLRISDSERRSLVLGFLANRLDEPLRSDTFADAVQALLDALTTLSQRKSFETRNGAYTSRGPVFPELQDALKQLGSRITTTEFAKMLHLLDTISDEEARVALLSKLAPHIPVQLYARALGQANAIKSDSTRAKALEGLATGLPDALIADAFAAAKSCQAGEALVALAPRLSETQLAEAIDVALEWRSQAGRFIVRACASRLSQKQIEQVFKAASGEFGGEGVRLLADLAFLLSPEQLAEALRMARRIGGARSRFRTMLSLALHLPPELEQDAIADALTTARDLCQGYDRVDTLVALIPLLNSEGKAQAIKDLCMVKWDGHWAPTMLKRLAPHLSGDQAAWLLSIGKGSTPASILPGVVAALAARLPAEQRQREINETFERAKRLPPNYERENALVSLAPYLSADQLAEALESTKAIEEFGARVRAMCDMASLTAAEVKQAILDDLYRQALAMQDETEVADALATLAPYLPLRAVEKALEFAPSIKSEKDRFRAIRALVVALPRDEADDGDTRSLASRSDKHRGVEATSDPRKQKIAEALRDTEEDHIDFDWSTEFTEKLEYLVEIAPDLTTEERKQYIRMALVPRRSASDRREALVLLAPILDDEEARDAFRAIPSFKDDGDRCSVISAFVPRLAADERAAALQMAREMTDAKSRAETLLALINHLPSKQRQEVLHDALQAAAAIGDVWQRSKVLTELLPFAPPECTSSLMTLLLDTSAETARQVSLDAVQEALPLVQTIGGQSALAELRRSIIDVCGWYP